MKSKKIKFANAVVLAAILTVVFIVSVTVYAEFSKSFKDLLARNFGHHWVGKGELAAILFGVLTILMFAFAKPLEQERQLVPLMKTLFGVILLGTMILTVFFIWHFFAVG